MSASERRAFMTTFVPGQPIARCTPLQNAFYSYVAPNSPITASAPDVRKISRRSASNTTAAMSHAPAAAQPVLDCRSERGARSVPTPAASITSSAAVVVTDDMISRTVFAPAPAKAAWAARISARQSAVREWCP